MYGWFWECPNGERCIYRHALPQGFVFKKALKEQEELQAQDSITLEELVENEVSVVEPLVMADSEELVIMALPSHAVWGLIYN